MIAWLHRCRAWCLACSSDAGIFVRHVALPVVDECCHWRIAGVDEYCNYQRVLASRALLEAAVHRPHLLPRWRSDCSSAISLMVVGSRSTPWPSPMTPRRHNNIAWHRPCTSSYLILRYALVLGDADSPGTAQARQGTEMGGTWPTLII
jgi:hypothetical protein